MKNPLSIIGLGALLFLLPWLAVTLIANVALAPFGPGTPTSVVGVETGPGDGLIAQSGVVQGQSSLELVASAAIVTSAVAALAWRLNKRRRKDEYYWYVETPKANPFVPLALLGGVAVAFYGLIALSENGPSIMMGDKAESVPSILPYLALAAIAAGSAVALLVSISVIRSDRLLTGASITVGEVERTELSDVLNEAANSLDLGSDYRSAILGCYRAMCQILDSDGTVDSSKLTAREFESRIAAKLNIGRAYLHEATLLFEKARYSATAVYEEDVKRSQVCLRELSEQVLSSHEQKRVN